MKAIICTKYGNPEVLKLFEVNKPVPKDDEVLIRIYATSVHRGDNRIRSLNIPGPQWQVILARLFLGINKPRKDILGMELAGIIEAVGCNVKKYKVGDEVFATTLWEGFGAYAEYKCMKETGAVAIKPANISFEEAAVLPAGGITTLGIFRKINLNKGQKVLIYGASGSIGTFALQIAKSSDVEITGVCGPNHIEFIKTLGANLVYDYTKSDYLQNLEMYDVVFDAVGILPPEILRKHLKMGGIYLNIHKDSDIIKAKDGPALLNELKKLVELGKIKPIIDKTYTLDNIVAAHRYVESGHKKGNVAITVCTSNY
jgi:NADPH:quinone reductase-like Zn-dependent oxidoreductase